MTDTWFTSDTHFFHNNIIKYCDRPFTSVEEMNEAMVNNWNQYVRPGDTIYHLGDFIFASNDEARKLLARLNGQKILIRGNHDRRNKNGMWQHLGFHLCFKELTFFSEFHQMKLGLSHYPDKLTDEEWILHGHVHQHWKQKGNKINVGVDVWDFKPVHVDQIAELVSNGPNYITKV